MNSDVVETVGASGSRGSCIQLAENKNVAAMYRSSARINISEAAKYRSMHVYRRGRKTSRVEDRRDAVYNARFVNVAADNSSARSVFRVNRFFA